MITLFQFPPVWGLPSASPFCMKLETYLRMAGLRYRIEHADVRKAPKHKLPYIDDDGRIVADSGFIVDYLIARYGDPLDAALTPAQRAQALALRRLMEEHLYWALAYARWIPLANWHITKRAYFGFMPWGVRQIVPELIRKKVHRDLHGHGLGRHREAEIYALGCADLSALSDALGSQAYFLGSVPTSVDATAFAWLANVLSVPIESPMKAHAQTLTNLVDYSARMHTRYFSVQEAR